MAAIPDPVQTAYEAAAAQRTLSLPTIPEELRALEADDLRGGAEEPLEAIDASGLIIADENFSELQAAHARFANCFLSCCDFSGSLFTDTVFEGCDFANSYFDNAGFTRCTFKNCKLTGAASALVLGEPMTPPIVGGVARTIAGLMLSNRKGSRRGQRRGHASPSSS